MLFPDNVDSLLVMLGLSDFVKSAAFTMQTVLLAIIALLM